MQHTNALIKESSPYLLQHAHNPVDWVPWSTEALKKAKKENKLLIVSIGYSACHWCHVMERESFENEEVAAVMNSHYINVKVDREERPDVDAVYMHALQLMTGQGGWPLNIVILPDGRPVWGGTYFPKENWIDALKQIAKIQKEQPVKLEEYASRLKEGIAKADLLRPTDATDFDPSIPQEAVSKWSQSFDTRQGGMRRAPKFMMPNNYQFLLRYAFHYEDSGIDSFVHRTLEQMAFGGIYDQVGGGFSRYSTDLKWHVPHFEKMLYDNAQLLSLYSEAFKNRPCDLYKATVRETVDFLKREMLDPSGGFYAALDADSINSEGELEEGAFYVWKKDQLKELLQEDFNLFASYYNINEYGHWEHGNYVLIRQDRDQDFAAENHMDLMLLKTKKEKWKKILLSFREKRPRPRLDDKILTGWNGLLISGLTQAHATFGDEDYLTLAINCAEFLCTHQLRDDNGLNRTFKNGKSTINGYLEDYAAVIQAFIDLYQITSEIKWLRRAESLMSYCLEHFYNKENGMFFFNSDEDPALIIRKIEYHDNVIPASNSIMAKNLFKLSDFLTKAEYRDKASQMLHNVSEEALHYASGFSNWLDLMLDFTQSHYQVVICGEKAAEFRDTILKEYLPHKIVAATKERTDDLELFKERYNDRESLIYVCQNHTCKLPVKTPQEAIALIEN